MMTTPPSPSTPVSPLLLLLLLLLFVFVSSSPSSSASLYDTFLHCLVNHTQTLEQQQQPQEPSRILHAPTNSSYPTLLGSLVRNRRFNTSSTPKPQLILTPSRPSHVQSAVLCTRGTGTQLRIRSGGHDYEGTSYVSRAPFLILDMFNFRSVDVDVKQATAWVGTGATLGELYYRIWEKSGLYGFNAGVCPTVGVGGHLSCGGYGNMLRKFGLASDSVVDAQIVDVEGRVLDRSSMGEDLFWAIRGGGGASFGVILGYKVKLVPVPKVVTVFRVGRTIEENATELVYQWQNIAPRTDNDLFMRLLLQPVSSKRQKGAKTVNASVLALFLGNADRLVSMVNEEFPELGLRKEDCAEMSWIESVLWWGNFNRGTAVETLLDRMPKSVSFLKRKSDYVQEPMSREELELLWDKLIELGKVGFVFNPYGGKMGKIPVSDTPFPHRAGNLFKIQYSISWSEDGIEAEQSNLAKARELYNFMTPYVSKNPRRAFLNYRDLDIGITDNGENSYEEGSVYGVKYFAENFNRLVKVKTAVDQQNFFRNEQSIPVLPRSSSAMTQYSGSTETTRKVMVLVILALFLKDLMTIYS
ncbi:berberine bridge enzyme-like 21 [Syzygium oleosum]|uniref:berberine bridge enzyme-like 21 n=1 Tax=Syzygium oleosum TaxID=219896 RepID=UPI0024BB20A2|nr:berberine bridge enzyme-like 21 [Syzygium oleosum]